MSVRGVSIARRVPLAKLRLEEEHYGGILPSQGPVHPSFVGFPFLVRSGAFCGWAPLRQSARCAVHCKKTAVMRRKGARGIQERG